MRLATALQIAGAGAMAALPVMAAAAPVRAASALPAKGPMSDAAPVRAATRAQNPSELIGFPILVFVGLFAGVAVAALVVAGRSRSPG